MSRPSDTDVDQEQQRMLWLAAMKAIGRMLQRELEPEQHVPDRLNELVARLEPRGTDSKF
jgi:hypothetical protein